MSYIFKAKTKTGQKLMYWVASGPRGKQARRELKRQCASGDIVEFIEGKQSSTSPLRPIADLHF
jgi:hypothetical protein